MFLNKPRLKTIHWESKLAKNLQSKNSLTMQIEQYLQTRSRHILAVDYDLFNFNIQFLIEFLNSSSNFKFQFEVLISISSFDFNFKFQCQGLFTDNIKTFMNKTLKGFLRKLITSEFSRNLLQIVD